MKAGLNVSLELTVMGGHDVAKFEEKLRLWLKQQPQVTGVDISSYGLGGDIAWREARKAEFGSRLRNPFARIALR